MPISTQNLPKKGKQESKIYHSRFILTSAVQGQVRKTIDRIYSRAMGTNEFSKGCMGLSVYLWCVLPIPLRLPIRNSFLVIFEGKMWKENGIRKTGIQHLPSKVHSWSFLRRKLYKEHGTRKARIQHLPSKVHSRNFLRRKLLKAHGTRKVGIQDLTLQSSFLELFEEETLKGTWDKKSGKTGAQNYR